MRLALTFILTFFLNVTIAGVTQFQTNSFSKVKNIYQSLHSDPKTTLLVFDIDDTLMTMSQSLGSTAWWEWQSDLIKNHKDSPELFTKDYNELLHIQGLLFELEKMEVTDEFVLPFLHQATKDGATVLALTARGSVMMNPTLMQLEDNKFATKKGPLFKVYGLKFNNQTSYAGDFPCPKLKRPILYHEGVMFLAGGDKGEALTCALNQNPREFKTIIYVDDEKRNIESIKKSFMQNKTIHVMSVLYTKEHAKQAKVRTSKKIHQRMLEQWRGFKEKLHQIIKKPSLQ